MTNWSDYNSSWVPNNNESSAFVGLSPNTERDWYIVRGLLRAVGMPNADPAEGYVLAPKNTGDDYTSKRPAVITGLIIVLVAITCVTGTRLALRASMSQMRFGVDDWATIAAAAMGLTYTACQLCMAIVGGGDHIWEHTYEDYNLFLYYGTLDKLIFYITVALVKLSLTLFIRRLADRASKAWRWFCDFFLLTLVAYILIAIFWFCFSCEPPRAQWDKWYSGTLATPTLCLDTTLQGEALNVAHVVQGAILLTSPVVILWNVTMEWKKKLRLFLIWGVGLLAVLFGLMRMLRADFTSDIMWTYTELLIWTSLDISVGIVVISLPVMDAWLAGGWRKAMTKMGRTTTGGGLGKSGYGNLERSGFGTRKSSKSAGGLRSGGGGGMSGGGGSGSGMGSSTTHTTLSSANKEYAESTEFFDRDRKDGAMELAIMRTDEYAVQFSRVDEESLNHAARDDGYGAHAIATPGTQTQFHGHGIAR